MGKQVYSAFYLEGIKDAGSFKRKWNTGEFGDTSPMTTEDMQKELETEVRCLRLCPGTAVADMHRGARDYWKNQIKRAKAEG
ncbi:hypothetical protein [Asaia prunellae]|uniref:hypothetical protein n=1 Tax=Asaia prunellae TaxID=610245 RepID=UPI0004712296|nr:hypothetical protein [Asaia prunellae]